MCTDLTRMVAHILAVVIGIETGVFIERLSTVTFESPRANRVLNNIDVDDSLFILLVIAGTSFDGDERILSIVGTTVGLFIGFLDKPLVTNGVTRTVLA
jgi:hypothetical protein